MSSPIPISTQMLLHYGKAPALSDGQQTLNYQQVADKVTRVSQWLASLPAQRIAIRGPNTLSWIIADLSLAQSQKICVPIPRFFSQAQQSHILQFAEIDLILDTELTADSLPTPVPDLWYQPVSSLERMPYSRSIPMDSGKITFTSGTTGTPKGVCLSWSQQAKTLQGLQDALAEIADNDNLVHLCLLPLATLLENQAGVYLPLALGQQILVLPEQTTGLSGSSRLDLQSFAHTLLHYQPNSMILTPQLLMALLWICQQHPILLNQFRFLAVGGAHCSPHLLQQAQQLGLPVYQGYGLSEAGSVVTLNLPSANSIGTVGRALSHLQIRIQQQRIEVKGSLFSGYVGEPAPASDSWLDTGDLGTIDDAGFLTITGRSKHLLITSFGRNISPEWIEAEVQLCPAVAQVLILGDAKPWLSAIIVLSAQSAGSVLYHQITALNRRLPDYAQIRGVVLAHEPFSVTNKQLTENGRLRREQIMTRYQTAIAALYCKANPSAELLIQSSHEEHHDELLPTFN